MNTDPAPNHSSNTLCYSSAARSWPRCLLRVRMRILRPLFGASYTCSCVTSLVFHRKWAWQIFSACFVCRTWDRHYMLQQLSNGSTTCHRHTDCIHNMKRQHLKQSLTIHQSRMATKRRGCFEAIPAKKPKAVKRDCLLWRTRVIIPSKYQSQLFRRNYTKNTQDRMCVG